MRENNILHGLVVIGLKVGRFRLDVRNKFLIWEAVRPWHSCPEKLWVPHAWSVQGQVAWGPGQSELLGAALPMVGGWN